MKTPTNTKNLILKLILLCAALLWGITAQAQYALNAWSTSSGNSNSIGSGAYLWGTTNFAVGSIYSASGRQATATFLSATSDLLGANVTIWQDPRYGTNSPGIMVVSNSTTTIQLQTRYDSTGTNVVASDTNSLVLGKPIIIRHVSTEQYELRAIATITATNFTVNAAPYNAIANGDLVYPLTQAASIPCGSNTITIGPGSIIAAQTPLAPFAASVNLTTSGSINNLSGIYQ